MRLIVIYTTMLHLIWGLLILMDNQVLGVTAISGLRWSRESSAMMLITVSMCALVAMILTHSKGKLSFILLLPQQQILTMSAGTALVAIGKATYSDGIIHPRAFITADQFPAILMCILYTVALLYMKVGRSEDISG